ncbi:MAG: heme ABC exporter ATP-binding protein CcmA [Sphingomonadaceae bacterium]
MSAGEGGALLELDGIACLRGGRLLFEELTLGLGPGEATLVTGPNGAGKTSLIRIAAGLLKPAAGSVNRARAALADDLPALDERQSLARALGFWARLDGADARAGMAAMGLAPLANVPVRMLSAGQRRRAGLARAVASGAPLWLLDEPANGLDKEGAALLGRAMAAHLEGGGAILAASHIPLPFAPARTIALGAA